MRVPAVLTAVALVALTGAETAWSQFRAGTARAMVRQKLAPGRYQLRLQAEVTGRGTGCRAELRFE